MYAKNFISLYFIFIIHGVYALESKSQIHQLIPNIAGHRFANCGIILTFNTMSMEYLDLAHQIQLTLARSYVHDTYLINFATFVLAQPKIFPSRLGSIHKLRPNCVISIVLIEYLDPTTFNQLYQLLIPRNYEISKKDEDYYLIYGKHQFLRQILLSEKFGMMLKFKLLLVESEQVPLLDSYSVCFYCNPGKYGKERVVQLSLDWLTIPPIEHLFPDFVKAFNGQEIRVVVARGTHQQARIRPVTGNPGVYEKWRGSYFYVLDHLAQIFNFTYMVRHSTGGGTGLLLPNKTWVGTTGDVFNHFADIGLVTAITYQRYRYVSYSYSLSWEWLTFATAIPKPTLSWEAILWPFDMELWACLFSGIMLTILAMWISNKIMVRLVKRDKPWTAAEFVYGTLLEQSFNLPEVTPLRVITTVWLIFGIVMGTGYKSKLVTALVFPVYNKPPDTFTELAYSGYKVGLCYVGGAAYAVFKTSSNPTYVRLANTMELFNDITDCFISTLEGNRGCIGYDSMANYVLAKNLTDRKGRKLIVVTSASTFFVACGFVMTKRAIFRLNWDLYIMTWDDMAIITKWRSLDFESVRRQRFEWEIRENVHSPEVAEEDGPSKLQIGNFQAIFTFLFLGNGLGLIIFLSEILRAYVIPTCRRRAKSLEITIRNMKFKTTLVMDKNNDIEPKK